MTQLIVPTNSADKLKIARSILAIEDNGTPFTIVNVKADGTLREYRAMTNVKAGLKGGESTTKDKKNLLSIFDTTVEQYRAVNLDTLVLLSFGENDYIFTDNATAATIKDMKVARPLDSAAVLADTALKVILKAISQ